MRNPTARGPTFFQCLIDSSLRVSTLDSLRCARFKNPGLLHRPRPRVAREVPRFQGRARELPKRCGFDSQRCRKEFGLWLMPQSSLVGSPPQEFQGSLLQVVIQGSIYVAPGAPAPHPSGVCAGAIPCKDAGKDEARPALDGLSRVSFWCQDSMCYC